jgi:hypothetical protein
MHYLPPLEVSGGLALHRSRLGVCDGVRLLLLTHAIERRPEGVTTMSATVVYICDRCGKRTENEADVWQITVEKRGSSGFPRTCVVSFCADCFGECLPLAACWERLRREPAKGPRRSDT